MGRRKRQSLDDNLSGDGGFGGGGGRLKDWREAGSIVVFLHSDSGITPRLFHLIPYMEKNDDGKKQISFFPFICHEDPENYCSKAPAQNCPVCRAIDVISDDGTVDDDAIVWKVDIGNKQKNRASTKLDFCNLQGGDWRGSFKPRAQYVVVVINAEKPDKGLQIDVEPQSLGDSLMKLIKNEIEGNGPEMGDPRINPYGFKFTYDSDAAPKDKYDAFTYRRAEVSEEVIELLSKPALDIDDYIDPGDSKTLRKIMEAHFKADLDLDELFNNTLDDEHTRTEERSTSTDADDRGEPAPEPEEESGGDMGKLCDTCDGKGTIGKKKMECPDCGGTGVEGADEDVKTSAKPEQVPCDTCDGMGTIGKKKMECPDCEGTGLVDEEVANARYPDEEAAANAAKEEEKKEKKRQRERERRAQKKAEKEAAEQKAAEESGGEIESETKCGGCQRMIPDDATICPYCGAEFGDDEEGD